jgi:hypothetical protein
VLAVLTIHPEAAAIIKGGGGAIVVDDPYPLWRSMDSDLAVGSDSFGLLRVTPYTRCAHVLSVRRVVVGRSEEAGEVAGERIRQSVWKSRRYMYKYGSAPTIEFNDIISHAWLLRAPIGQYVRLFHMHDFMSRYIGTCGNTYENVLACHACTVPRR